VDPASQFRHIYSITLLHAHAPTVYCDGGGGGGVAGAVKRVCSLLHGEIATPTAQACNIGGGDGGGEGHTCGRHLLGFMA